MNKLSRRDWMTWAVAAAGSLSFEEALGSAKHPNKRHFGDRPPAGSAPDSLNGLAQAKGLRFGSCIGTGIIKAELELLPDNVRARPRRPSAYENTQVRVLMASQCGILVPENELKFYAVQPQSGVFDFRRAQSHGHARS